MKPEETVLCPLEHELIRLRERGLANAKIASQMGLSISITSKRIARLIGSGHIEKRSTAVSGLSLEERSTHDEVIIVLRRRKKTYEEIGTAIRRDREYVRLSALRLTEERGEEIFDSEWALYAAEEVASQLETSAKRVRKLCREGVVTPQRKGREYFFTEEEMGVLQRHLDKIHKKTCYVCGTPFRATGKRHRRLTCSTRVCRIEYKRQAIRKQRGTLPSEKWSEALNRLIREHELDPERVVEEEFIGREKAMELSGLNFANLDAIEELDIITVIPHPTRKWGGRPARTYLRCEMLVARYVHVVYV